ncbi:MAG: DUF58 domain-containing protein [Chitinophagaceae bacterium]|nr:DUF58 domain-containing protein [Chitinophagaceae bacterium]
MSRTPFYNQLYFNNRLFLLGLAIAASFVFTWALNGPLVFPKLFLLVALILLLADFVYLFLLGYRFTCVRQLPARLSNGDINLVQLQVWHSYPFSLRIQFIEELPEQFQARNNVHLRKIPPRTRSQVRYELRPVLRGVYDFGHTVCMLQSGMGLLQRRLQRSQPDSVKVYPSYLPLRRFQLVAQSAALQEPGGVRLRKVGHSMEFETIKEYVSGDDVRAVNWKATARKAALMVNHYMEERSQQVYCIIDKGRLMKMPFNGLSLLDYAINSSLVLASVALHRQDRFGLLTFSHKQGEYIAADKKPGQLKLILEALYRMETVFWESDYEKLYLQVRHVIKQRSLLILFTNFESVPGMRRQLPYLRQLAQHHLLLVVFFQNSELAALAEADSPTLEDVYTSTVAGKFVFEKKMIVKELATHGILTLLTEPESLSVQTVNKYLEIKARQVL